MRERAPSPAYSLASRSLLGAGGSVLQLAEADRLTILDAEATPRIVNTVEESDTEEGIRLRVERETQDETMETTSVDEIS